MKHFFLCIILTTTSFVNAQLADTACIKSRWISVQFNDHNQPLFSRLEDGRNLLTFVKELVESKKIKVYNADNTYTESKENEWYYLRDHKHPNELASSPNYSDSLDIILKIYSSSHIPLSNSYGEDSIYKYDDGTFDYVYPEPNSMDFYYINVDQIKEVRIKESKVFDEKVGAFVFKPVGLSFVEINKYFGYENELFWLNLSELCFYLENGGFTDWSSFIKGKKYLGFQYLQTPCYGAKITY